MSKKVVFVDDSKMVLMTAQMTVKPLVDAGQVELVTFENPLDVIEQVENGILEYDLLITDINMPQMNGLDMARKLKSMDRVKLKPILAEFCREKTASQGDRFGGMDNQAIFS